MATKKISELEAINAAEDNDILVIVDTSESTTNKITKGNLLIGAGHTIEMTLNENYQIVLVLKNAAGTALSTQTIDLPNENAVTNLAYNNGILTVTKQSGATSQINLMGLIEGLVTESDFNTFKEALQTTLEAINEKDAEQDEAIAENYKVINKLNEKLENQQKVIDQLPQVTGQGTEVTLQDTIEAQFTKFDVEGNSVQDGTPSPDNEVPILSAGDNENLVNESNINFTYSSVNKVIYDNGLIKTIQSPNGQFYEFDEPLQSGETYTLTFKFVQGRVNVQGSQDFSIGMYHSGNNNSWQGNLTKTQIANIDLAGKTFTLTHKATDTITGLYIFIYSSPTFVTPLWFNVKVEKGNKASGYSPYGMGSINQEIINKNLINFDKLAWYPIKDDGIIDTSKQGAHTDYIKIARNEDYIFRNIKFVNGVYYYISYYDSKKVHLRNETAKWVTNLTEINSSDATYIIISWLYISPNEIKEKLNPQLEPGSTATPYVEHKEQDYSIFVQQPIRSIGDVRDLFFKNTVDNPYYDENLTLNGWYERHYINRKIFDGTENWQFSTESGVAGIYMLNPPIDDMVQGNFLDGLSNYFHNDKSGKGKNSIRFGGNNNVIYIYVDSNEFPDKTSFTSWLAEKYASGHPLYIDYISAEPLDLPCTPEQVEQIENKPSTYKDFTIINSEDETPAYLEVSGIRDIDTMFDKVTNAIVSLGGNV